MTESQGSPLSAQVIQAKVALEHREEAFDLAALALVRAGLSHPKKRDEELLA